MTNTREGKPAETSADESATALEDAFAQYQSELLGTLYYLVGNTDDARDALQEAFIKCWRHRNQVPQVRNLKAWVFRIALNTGRDLRGSAWRRKRHSLDGSETMIESKIIDPGDDASAREDLKQLRQAVAGLRPEEQEVFLLRQNGDLTYEQIGEALDLPTGTVKTRMRLALTKLRQVLAPL